MTTKLVAIDPQDPEKTLRRCREVVRSGGVIAFPTDTFYGLGVDPRNAGAIDRLFSIKGRSAGQPILLLMSDAAEVPEWAASVTQAAERLISRFWPGALTLVFDARADVLPALTAGTGRIGLRVPGNELTRSLLRYVGSALTGTSANRAGESAALTADEVAGELGDQVDLIVDGGPTAGGLPSTVVDVAKDLPRIIRQGVISEAVLFP